MFLLRCAFWLSIVYAAMFFGLPWAATRSDATAASPTVVGADPLDARAFGRSAAAQAVAGVVKLCGGHERECLGDAAGLTALVESAIAGEPDYVTGRTAGPGRIAAKDGAAPLPVPDPRRHGMLTRQP